MNIEFNLPPALVIGLLVSTVLPILVGLISSRVTSSRVKAVALAVVSAATGLLTELGNSIAAGVTYDLGLGLVLALTAFLVATAMHFGLWKPTQVSEKAQRMFVAGKHSA